MKVNVRLVILITIFVSMLGYLLYDRGVFSRDGDADMNRYGTTATDDTPDLAALTAIRTPPIPALRWEGDWGEDPFFYAEAETTEAGETSIITDILGGSETANFDLLGITWRGNQGAALINGDVVGEGDRISGYLVTKIAYDYVILRRGTNIVRVSLND